jgi:SAM-dependent methyltransferase
VPSLQENLEQWDSRYSWEGRGDEWSAAWGGTENQWWGTLMPRLHSFLPAGTALEIGPGFGRWTQFLKDVCQHLTVVDVSDRCIDACRERFSSSSNLAFHVNDGRSLPMVRDDSLDFAFSFDSLVHAEVEILESYLTELAAKLKPGGHAFIHHSNMGQYERLAALARKVPERLRRHLVVRGLLVNVYGWRAESVTAEIFDQCSRQAGLRCVSQERINWMYGRHVIDCISVVTSQDSPSARPVVRYTNRAFMREANRLAEVTALYDRSRRAQTA